VIARFPPAVGGTERQAALLARWLAGRGVRVTVVTQAHPGAPAREALDGVEIVRLAPPAGGKVASLLFCMRLARHLRERGGDYDLAQAFLASSPALVVREFARRRGVPAFLKFGASGPAGDLASSLAAWGGSWKLRRLRSGFARYLCPNEEIRHEFLLRGYAGERLVVLPNGVDTERFRPAEPRERDALRRELGWEGRTVALFAGRFEHQKNLRALLAAWEGVARDRPGALLALVGEGSQREELVREVSAKGLSAAVRLLPAETSDGVLRLLQAADLFVLPSLAEGLSNALLEAISTGLVPVVSRIAGNREVVEPLGSGLLFDLSAPGGLERALGQVLDDPDVRRAVSAAARRRALDVYGIEATGRSYLALAEAAIS